MIAIIFCLFTQQARAVQPVIDQFRASAVDCGLALEQHWPKALPGVHSDVFERRFILWNIPWLIKNRPNINRGIHVNTPL